MAKTGGKVKLGPNPQTAFLYFLPRSAEKIASNSGADLSLANI
jgi:hypothetical protein